jgi:glycosyltransferase involved in cell wall biosynthesis
MRILFPSRIVDRHVGGNTTYARRLRMGLEARGISTGTIPSSRKAVVTALRETLSGQLMSRDELIHYSADTGSLIPTRGPSVLTVHGVASRWINVARSPRQEATWRFRVSRAIRSSSRLITVSESAADDVAEVFGVDRQTIRVIPHGVDIAEHSAPRVLSAQFAALVPKNYCLYLGNLEPRKNLVELIKAFRADELSSMGIPLVIAGRPAWNFREILESLGADKDVIHLGFVSDEDRIALMQNTSLFVFPSLYEGFGMPVLEAMAAGAPVASSRRGSLEEVAGPAWTLDDLSGEGLAHSLASALGDSKWLRQARSDGVQWAEKFDWEKSIDAHIEVYREAAK